MARNKKKKKRKKNSYSSMEIYDDNSGTIYNSVAFYQIK